MTFSEKGVELQTEGIEAINGTLGKSRFRASSDITGMILPTC